MEYFEIHLAATAHAEPVAVMFVQATLKAWNRGSMIRTAEQVVRILIGNAVRTTGTTDEIPTYKVQRINMLALRMASNDTTIFIEVWDSSAQPPAGPAPTGHQSGYFFHQSGGKVVWTKIPIPLPKRTPSAFPHPPVWAEADNQPSQYTNDRETIKRVGVALADL